MTLGTAPERVVLHRASAELELVFKARHYRLSHEFLRVHSPSAEIRGHSGQPKLVPGKRQVTIERIEPVGRYALQLIFSDGHESGLYTWTYLYELCRTRHQRWTAYLQGLQAAGARREETIIVKG